MKIRYLLSLICICFGLLQSKADTYSNNADNTIYVNNATVQPGGQVQLVVVMKNNVPISGIQFDMYLPDGVSADATTQH